MRNIYSISQICVALLAGCNGNITVCCKGRDAAIFHICSTVEINRNICCFRQQTCLSGDGLGIDATVTNKQSCLTYINRNITTLTIERHEGSVIGVKGTINRYRDIFLSNGRNRIEAAIFDIFDIRLDRACFADNNRYIIIVARQIETVIICVNRTINRNFNRSIRFGINAVVSTRDATRSPRLDFDPVFVSDQIETITRSVDGTINDYGDFFNLGIDLYTVITAVRIF